ncbi:MAG: hydroxyethylthiazole kinase [Bacillota bacterium]
MFEDIFRNVQENPPLVHCITNYVTVNDCANIVLACGGAPIMADDIAEVEEITSICSSLVINIGTLNERTIASMIKAGKKANEVGHPVILDPVGAGASKLRTHTVQRLVEEVKFSVIRGNISEIKTVHAGSGSTRGVDANEADRVTTQNLDSVVRLARSLSNKTGAVIAITGETDIVSDSLKTYVISNGHPMMSRVTGTGCMLSCVVGSWCGANPDSALDSAAAAVAAVGLCGELAWEKTVKEGAGTGSYRTYLIDAMSGVDEKILNGGMKLEIR